MPRVDILHGSNSTQLQYSSGTAAGEGETITLTYDHLAYPVLVESNLRIVEGDVDWHWEERDRWNATVDGIEATLLTVMMHWPNSHRETCTEEFLRCVCRDLLQHLENNF